MTSSSRRDADTFLRDYGDQDENGIDLSLIRRNLRLTPQQRLRQADRLRRDALRLNEYGRQHRTQQP